MSSVDCCGSGVGGRGEPVKGSSFAVEYGSRSQDGAGGPCVMGAKMAT